MVISHTTFSIVVPVYNAKQYLDQCVESVLRQTYPYWELILVDDGSKDQSGELCDAFAQRDARIHVIHQKNSGPACARSVGIVAATGAYLVFLDSDDYLADDLLAQITSLADSYAPDVILFNSIGFSDERREPMNCLLEPGVYEGNRLEIVRNNVVINEQGMIAIPYALWGKAFRRSMLLEYQSTVPKFLYKGEDLAITAPLIADAERVAVSDFCGYFYRDTPNSIMHTFRKGDIDQAKLTAAYLEQKMDSSYQGPIDAFVVSHYFDYLSRAIPVLKGYRAYRNLIQETLDPAMDNHLKRAKCYGSTMKEKLIFSLLKYRRFGLLWILRKLKPFE